MISPVLKFNGECEEALAFYEKAFGATNIFKDYYRDAPDDSGLPNKGKMADKIMHSGITICGTQFNMSDEDEPISVEERQKCNVFNVFLKTDDRVKNAYNTLKEGGKVIVELGPQFFHQCMALL